MRADCTGKRLFDIQIAPRFGSKMRWVEIYCARFLDAGGVLGATRELGATCVLDAMDALMRWDPVQRASALVFLVFGELGVG
jgi:hypothetical protein